MAKINLEFIDSSNDDRRMKVSKEDQIIKIDIFDSETKEIISINLDKSTAIRFSKALRTEINKINPEWKDFYDSIDRNELRKQGY